MSDLIPISALVGDRTFRVKIETADEEVVRKTLKTINGKDMQDYISMVLLWFATEQHAGRAADVELDNLTDQLNNIEKLLDGSITGTTPAM